MKRFAAALALILALASPAAAQLDMISAGGGVTMAVAGTCISLSPSSGVTNVTISTCQDLSTTSAPSFARLALSGYTASGSSTTALMNATATLNTTGVIDAVKWSFTDTAHGALSNLFAIYGGVAGTTLEMGLATNGTLTVGNNVNAGGALSATTSITAGATAQIFWTTRASLLSPAAAIVQIADNAGTGAAGFRMTGFAIANIATVLPANGDIGYCTDCTIANPCAGGGTGAIAKRLNGVNVCN